MGTPTFTVHEVDGAFVYYRPNSSQPLARYDLERQVLAAARHIGDGLNSAQMRVAFIIPTKPD
jgi:hypothetical protein